jgi:hypothetical protein
MNFLKIFQKKKSDNFNQNLIGESKVLFSKIWIQLLFPPFMLYFWGFENFNTWLFIFSVPQLLLFYNIATTIPVRNELSICYANKEFSKLKKIFNNSLITTSLNILLLILLYFVFLFLSKNNQIISENIYSISILFISTIISLMCGIFYVAISYKGNLSRYLNVEFKIDILIPIFVPLTGIITNNILYASIVYLLLVILKFFLLFRSIKDKNISLIPNINYIKIKVIKDIYKKSLGFNLELISMIIRNSGLIFILGLSNKLIFVGLISTAKTMFQHFPIRIFNILNNSLMIQFSSFYKNNKFDKKIRKLFFNSIIVILFFLFLFLSISYFFGVFIYDIWTNKNYNLTITLLLLIMLDTIFYILGNFLIIHKKAINKYSKISLIELFINLLTFFSIFIYANQFTINKLYSLIVLSSFVILLIKFTDFIINFYFKKEYSY